MQSRQAKIITRLGSALETEDIPKGIGVEVVILPCEGRESPDGPHHHVMIRSDAQAALEIVTVNDGPPLNDSDIQARIDRAATNFADRLKGRTPQPPVDERDARLMARMAPPVPSGSPEDWGPLAALLGLDVQLVKGWQFDGERFLVGTHVQVAYRKPDEDAALTHTIAGELTDVDDTGIHLAGSYFICHRDITDAEAIEVQG